MLPGVNYPWRRYGGDVGPTVWGTHHGIASEAQAVAEDFAALAAAGVRVVRWFLFTDARGGIAIDARGWPDGFLPGTLDDLDALLSLAREAGLQLVPVLFDHSLAFPATTVAGATVGGHAAWLGDPHGQARLLDTVVAPLMRRYGARGSHGHLGAAIHAWDLLNEPDWIVRELYPSPRVTTPVLFDVLAAWVREATQLVRQHEAGGVTIGNARLRFARWWDAPAFDFDFLQAHAYYDPAHDFDLLETSHAALGLSRPLVVGECSARGDAEDAARGRPGLSLETLARSAHARGYSATWPWSWRGVDAHGGLGHEDLRALRAAYHVEPR